MRGPLLDAMSWVLVFLPAVISTSAGWSAAPRFTSIQVSTSGHPTPAASVASGEFSLIARQDAPQVAVMKSARTIVVSLRRGERVEIATEADGLEGPCRLRGQATLTGGASAHVEITLGPATTNQALVKGRPLSFAVSAQVVGSKVTLRLKTSTLASAAAVRWQHLQLAVDDQWNEIPLDVDSSDAHGTPPRVLPNLRAPIEQALIEWDWRMQDGIGTVREPRSYQQAIQRTLRQGEDLIRHLVAGGAHLNEQSAQWQALRHQWNALSGAEVAEAGWEWEDLWRRVHALRRQVALSNPFVPTGPVLFIKQPTASFSHQLTQYVGRHARPGGGVFVLDRPGHSLRCRPLAPGALPPGSYQHPEVSYGGDRVLFSYCQVDAPPSPGLEGRPRRYYHVYEMSVDGNILRQLTDGPFDDISPRYLPNGRIVFVSTRRGGWHRCGGSPGQGCETHTLALMDADGTNPRTISFHETHEWDPAVLNDGRIIYTRWDYVDRHAVYYEQLWSARPDGTRPSTYFGNNTFNPVGIWEASPVPGSTKVMATAAAHHAMTAGSIILLDVNRGVDGLQAITRLTPDAPFPESEARVLPRNWHAPAGVERPPDVPPEAIRWPGHCYKSPYALSDTFFLAAYSYDALIGEPDANPVNMFGIYLMDRFGNKELLYRDPGISSLWPVPLRPRKRPPDLAAGMAMAHDDEGVLFVQNVYQSDRPLPPGSIHGLRVVQVLPKSTPGINWPRVGIPNASPGKQVLGTVPVHSDGSACFRAPAGVPLSLQALDQRGRAVHIMRSVVYLQPGEMTSCTGCHEPRDTAPPLARVAEALRHPPSTIRPGPDGAKPLSYPLLVQPVLDRHCVRCHNDQRPDGGVRLSGQPQGHFSVSYNALAPRVPHSAWGGKPGDFREVNSEPRTEPGFFGARASKLMTTLLEGHYDVELSDDDIERLVTWMDTNVLFYGTFNQADQARQQRGQRIDGPDLQ